jgi:hypothetical protein
MTRPPTGHSNLTHGESSWAEYRHLVIQELDRLNNTLDKIQIELATFRTDIALLKFQASMWGVASGAISGTLVTVGAILLRQL